MAIRVIAKTAKGRIRNTSLRPSSLSKDEFKAAFGAKAMNLHVGNDSSPVALLQLREQVMERLRSTGGRPALSDAAKKMKIPVTEQDWRDMEKIAQNIEGGKFKPSTAQVASVILHMALQSFSEFAIRDNIEKNIRGIENR